jgi:hypothetical protein
MPDMKDMPLLPDAHYGKISTEEPDPDAELPEVEGIDEDDDELQAVTDPALVAMLGFDPLEWEDEDEDETVTNDDGSVSKRVK